MNIQAHGSTPPSSSNAMCNFTRTELPGFSDLHIFASF